MFQIKSLFYPVSEAVISPLARLIVCLIIIPHSVAEISGIQSSIEAFNEVWERNQTLSQSIYYYSVIYLELIALLFVAVGFYCKAASASLFVVVSLHFLQFESNALSHHFLTPIQYSSLFLLLLFITLKGSGLFSLDAVLHMRKIDS